LKTFNKGTFFHKSPYLCHSVLLFKQYRPESIRVILRPAVQVLAQVDDYAWEAKNLVKNDIYKIDL